MYFHEFSNPAFLKCALRRRLRGTHRIKNRKEFWFVVQQEIAYFEEHHKDPELHKGENSDRFVAQ